MSFFGKLFGSEKALNSVVTGVAKGLDALVYTDEEKAGDASKERTEARQMVVAWMSATQGQNLSRRIIALSVTATWLLQFIIAQIITIVAIFVGDITRIQLTEAAVILRGGASDMSSAVMLILAFYFAAPHMGTFAKAALAKFGKKSGVIE